MPLPEDSEVEKAEADLISEDKVKPINRGFETRKLLSMFRIDPDPTMLLLRHCNEKDLI